MDLHESGCAHYLDPILPSGVCSEESYVKARTIQSFIPKDLSSQHHITAKTT